MAGGREVDTERRDEIAIVREIAGRLCCFDTRTQSELTMEYRVVFIGGSSRSSADGGWSGTG